MRGGKQHPIITLMTDFGTDDVFIGVMKGVILGINPAVRIVDLTHAVPPQSVEIGALLLRLALPYFPNGTIHVAVVDPGVGTARRAVAVETASGVLLGPDNGLLAPAAEQAGIRRLIDCTNQSYWLPRVTSTFHGRDIYAPVAAHLSLGVAPDCLGQAGAMLTPLALPIAQREQDGERVQIRGKVIWVDRFGNLLTNVTAQDIGAFPRQELSVSIGDVVIHGLVSAYAAVPGGELLVLVNSWGLLEIARRNGSAGEHVGVGSGASVVVTVWPTVKSDAPMAST
jgi:S-adenosylmethionine hydrolase